MKKLSSRSVLSVFFISLVIGFTSPSAAFAVTATAPSLGTAAPASVLAGSAITADGSGATISGDLDLSPAASTFRTGSWTVGGTEYFAGAGAGAVSDATAAWTTMGSAGGTAWNPVTDLAPLPGLYTRSGDATFNNTLTLDGSATDVWIFQINSSLTFTGTINLTGSAQACNVFWRIASDATINSGGVGSKFVGTLIANGNVSLVGGATVNGRMMALTGTLSTAGVTNITGPTCATSVLSTATSRAGATINVVKVVVNDGGGTKTIADFPLFVNGTAVVSGVTNTFPAPAGAYTVTETSNSNYVQSFSGDCDASGQLNLNPGDNKFCIITNNDIAAPIVPPVPPLIDVVKTASPLSLPDGPGSVVYTYTLRNIGTVPVTNVTMVGDTCSPIVLSSGDINTDGKLEVNETWVYHCTTRLSETHTNTVVATGWANGISAVDIASATVIVGAPTTPPLIHITKVPSPLSLPVGGGVVTYTYTVTNPGTVSLGNVGVSDDKCTGLPSRVVGHPGDLNNNDLLESSETWSFTCKSDLTKTTTNIATAKGEANGLTARDFAIATVVVAIPRLPNTGFAPTRDVVLPLIVVGIAAVLFLLYVNHKKKNV